MYREKINSYLKELEREKKKLERRIYGKGYKVSLEELQLIESYDELLLNRLRFLEDE